jgi:hypothetical protein
MVDEFSLGTYPQSSVLVVYSERHEIELDPDYQRLSGIWTREKRQLLLDTLLNGFDVPKLYFHEFVPAKHKGQHRYRYAIIDGKQRLQTIWDFIDGKIALADDFKYLRDGSVSAGGLSYSELATRYPQLKTRFDATPLDIITIRTNDIDLIEDMFSRLNEAVPLNAPEKRNAFGGPMPAVIRDVARHPFLAKRVPFTDKRYRHRDLACKFLYLEHEDDIANTKKPDLDDFVKSFRTWRQKGLPKASTRAVTALLQRTEATLNSMAAVFATRDSLLRQVGMITLYYHLFRFVEKSRVSAISREMLKWFEQLREDNRTRAEQAGETDAQVDRHLLEFDKHSQTPNDAYAIRIRLGILLRYLAKHKGITFDKSIVRQKV